MNGASRRWHQTHIRGGPPRRLREVRGLEAKRDQAWRDYDQASRGLDRKKETLLDEIGRRLEQRSELGSLFTVRWRLA